MAEQPVDISVEMASHFSGLSKEVCAELFRAGWCFTVLSDKTLRWEKQPPIDSSLNSVNFIPADLGYSSPHDDGSTLPRLYRET